ncbi:RNase adapter RapZ [Desulfovibrio subterraneus]|jgi:UPF0042 nucleotide-binding protein|uniref:Nucleotide-binding protein n=1 Tax=Desulfovibrio subterraneus TaxID=2718620 RepID=A0A7J0BKT4_9BACT|nr:RNase adapter RapZ [Desulfovibrio subterraneus]WBF67982.1 RNase adapter RapZ [Desulfovibrio subterraneus]GFM33851.1 nucleotide-binding protein [Desulfovibrio subterraneus]
MDSPVAPSFPILVVTGLSGGGKSTVLRVFEDLRYYTIDGLPVTLALQMVSILDERSLAKYRGLVLGMDLRHIEFDSGFDAILQAMREKGLAPAIIFMEARPDVIVRRYKETRRPHPLESGGLGLEQAMETERRLLEPVRAMADLVIDTSDYSIHDIRRIIQQKWTILEGNRRSMRVHLLTFGFKYGTPAEADMVFDLRFLPNPYHEPELRPLSGKDPAISQYVLGAGVGKEYLERLTEFLHFTLTQMEGEGRYRATVAIGCTGGRHRSVAAAEALFEALKNFDFAVSIEHRHMELV